MTYTISEAAARIGVAPSALRYYDKEGLLPNIKRKGGQRVFEDKDLRFLYLLNCLKNTGMPVKRIRKYVQLIQQGNSTLQERHEIIKEQRQFILDQIDQLNFYLCELDFKEWYYKKAIAQGNEEGITLEDYEKETGTSAPEISILSKDK